MHAPHAEPCNTRSSRFGHDKITDARLVGASTIVDDEHVPFVRVLERFEEQVDAAGVPTGQRSACDQVPAASGRVSVGARRIGTSTRMQASARCAVVNDASRIAWSAFMLAITSHKHGERTCPVSRPYSAILASPFLSVAILP